MLQHAMQDDGLARSLQLAQQVKAALLQQKDLAAQEAHMAWRLARWQLFNARRRLIEVCAALCMQS